MKKNNLYIIGSVVLLVILFAFTVYSKLTYSVATNESQIDGTTLTYDIDMTQGQNTIIPLNVGSNTEVSWQSSDSSVVTVDSNGRINTVGTGTATITATYIDENNQTITHQYNITVKEGNEENEGEQGDPNEQEKVHELSQVTVNENSVQIQIDKSMIATIDTDTFTLTATAKNSNDTVTIEDNNNKLYSSGDEITWYSEQTSMYFQISVCGETLNSCTNYILVVNKPANSPANNFVDADFFESFSINDQSININEFFACDTSGTHKTCTGEYTLPETETMVIIEAPLNDGYSYNNEENSPGGPFSIPEDTDLQLEIYEDTILVGVYTVSIHVTKPLPSSPSSSSRINNNDVKPVNTGDMSSLLIFMIMIASLLASIIIYKKNINE